MGVHDVSYLTRRWSRPTTVVSPHFVPPQTPSETLVPPLSTRSLSTSTRQSTSACSAPVHVWLQTMDINPFESSASQEGDWGPPSAPHSVVDPLALLAAPSVAHPVAHVQWVPNFLPASGDVFQEFEDRGAGAVDLPDIQRPCTDVAAIERTVVEMAAPNAVRRPSAPLGLLPVADKTVRQSQALPTRYSPLFAAPDVPPHLPLHSKPSATATSESLFICYPAVTSRQPHKYCTSSVASPINTRTFFSREICCTQSGR